MGNVSRNIENINLSVTSNADLNQGAQIDAGGRLRTSQLNTLLDIKQTNDNQPLLYDRVNIGSATQVYSKSFGGVTMSVSGNGDAAIVQSKQWATYFSGKSQFMEITFSDFANQTNVTKRAGYFSSNTSSPYDSNKDGIWFEADGTDYRLRIQKNGTDILNVAQSSWNLDTASWFDASKFNVFVVQFLYLGGTAVKLGFINEGLITWVHQYSHAGLIANTFIESPNQPVRYEIRSTGGAGSFKQICAQVSSEGSRGEVGIPESLTVTNFSANSANTSYLVQAFRLKSAYRNITVELQKLDLLATTNDSFRYILSINPVYNGSLTFNDVDDSAIQSATGGTANTVNGDFGKFIDIGFVTKNSSATFSLDSKLNIGTKIDGTADVLALFVTPFSNGLKVYSSLTINQFL